jgi:hypothetical protein
MHTSALHRGKLPTRKKMLVEALEHRILYSADAGALLLDDSESTPSAEIRIVEATTSGDINTSVTESVNQQYELVFVDTAIEDYQVLIDDILTQKDGTKQIEIILLNKETDGVNQISRVIDTYDNVSAIHLLSHGNEAELNLGTSKLTLESINQLYADAFQNIGNHLTADADILIYGCNFGQGSNGLLAMERLGQLTGADIAASDDITGNSLEIADWDLEVKLGEINSDVIINQSFTQNWSRTLLLFPPNIQTSSGSVIYTENDPAVSIDNGISITDIDSANLVSAQITITNNYNAEEDILSFTNNYGIIGNWDANTGTLSLSGTASVSNYEKALSEVTYINISESPNTAVRTITFIVNAIDLLGGTSNAALRNITVTQINDAGTFGGDISATINEDIH